MLAIDAHWCGHADVFTESKTRGKTHQIRPSITAAEMGLKFNFRAIPLHWRLLIGVQLGLSGAIMMYRQRVLAVKAKKQQE